MTANPNQTLQQALDLHAKGRFGDAERLYMQCLMDLPDNGDVLGMLGILRLQTGRPREALPHLEKAARQRPGQANYHMALGEAWRLLKQPGEALASYESALRLLPGNADLHNSLGIVLRDLERPLEAVDSLRRALRLDPRFLEARVNLGKVQLELGQHDEALACFRQAPAQVRDSAEFQGLMGKALAGLGQTREALEHFQKALAARPELAEIRCALGNVLLDLGRADEALKHYRIAQRELPDSADLLCNIGLAQKLMGREAEAEAQYRRVLDTHPEHARSLNNYGSLLQEQGRLAEARRHFEQAAGRQPDDAGIHYSLGNLCLEEGRLAEARDHLERALKARPDYPEAQFCRGMVSFMEGDLAAGWAGYEHRWRGGNMSLSRPAVALPQWRGETPAPDAGLLLYSEQGFGDAIQFIRYLPLVARRFARVVCYTRAPLLELFQAVCPPNCELRPMTAEFDPAGCQWQAPLMSLPLALGTTLESIPAQVPYLQADPERMRRWRQRLRDLPDRLPRVGLVWAGGASLKSDRKRSLPLSALRPLLRLESLRWISLQKGEAAAQRQGLADPEVLLDWMDEVEDFADCAALVANLDLVIAVDTAVAHLAGALGRPVWLLNRHESEWRWMRGRDSSPWYPGMRIFNQPEAGDWSGLVARVAAELSGVSFAESFAESFAGSATESATDGLARP